MVAIAGATKGQEIVPTFGAPGLFFDGGTSRSFAWGVAAGKLEADDPFPTVVVTYAEANRISHGYHTSLPGVVQVWNNTGDWSPAQDGLEYGQTISLGDHVSPAEVALVDFDNDEDLDMVVTAGFVEYQDGPNVLFGPTGVFTLSNNGGSFGNITFYPLGFGVRSLAVADLNNDGLPDIAAGVDPWEQRAVALDVVRVYKNDPANPGQFIDMGSRSTGHDPQYDVSHAVIIGEFNPLVIGAQHADILSGNYATDDVTVFKGTGGFNYTAVTTNGCPPPTGEPDWVFLDAVAAKLRTDHNKLDVVGLPWTEERLVVIHGNGNSGFVTECPNLTYPSCFGCAGGAPIPREALWDGLAVGHLNGGTKPDIVVTDPQSDRMGVLFFLGKGDGTLQVDTFDDRYGPEIDGGNPFNVCVFDLNGDGFDDIITGDHGEDVGEASVSVLINQSFIIAP